MNLKNKILIVLILTVIQNYTFITYSQPMQEWISVYPNSGNSSLTMCIDSSGNVYSSGNDGIAPYGFVTIKYNSNGQQIWARRFVGGMNFIARPLAMGCDPQGNIYVAAYDESMILVKYSTSGVQQWFRRYPANYLSDMVITKYGFPVITGTVINGAPTRNDCVTVKYNPNGDTLWSAIYNSPANNFDWSVAMDISLTSEICITGYSSNLGNTEIEFLTIKYDSNGVQQWVRTYGNSNSWDEAKDVGFDKDNNIFIFGFINANLPNYCLIKYNSVGNLEWNRIYHHIDNRWENPQKLKIDNFNNIILTGTGVNNIGSSNNILTVKYDNAGNFYWSKRYNNPSALLNNSECLSLDTINNIYITGIRDYFPQNVRDFVTFKYDSNGNFMWEIIYTGPDSISSGQNILLDKNYNIYVNGQQAVGSNANFVTMKYAQLIGINPITNEIPKEYKLFQNYPNPFNPSTTINYHVSQNNSFIEFTVYDLMGKEIRKLVDQKQSIGVYQINFSAENLSSGIYFYKLTVNGKLIDTKKMILVK